MAVDEIKTIQDIVTLAVSGCDDWKRYGNVKVREMDDLLIFNYSSKAAFEARWNFFEIVSRGLIINKVTGEIVARAFDKFFNWGEGGRTTDAPMVNFCEKVDGSLGILYRHNGEYRIATRGSFQSDQATWATEFLKEYNFGGLPNQFTLLFEIVYPGNRIVLDYGDDEDLILLGVRNRFTGEQLSMRDTAVIAKSYHLSMPQRWYWSRSADDLLSECNSMRWDYEGYVATFADGQRFKFKSREYMRMHKMIHSLTFKNVLGHVRDDTLDQVYAVIPDGFLEDTKRWVAEINDTVELVLRNIDVAFRNAPKESRRDFALWVREHSSGLQHYLFARLDRKDVIPMIYDRWDWTQLSEDK